MSEQVKSDGTTHTLFAAGDVQLECVLHRNVFAKRSVAVVVLHPYPWLGGCMYDHVVQELYSSFCATEEFNTVLMYNSRGTGVSTRRINDKEVAKLP